MANEFNIKNYYYYYYYSVAIDFSIFNTIYYTHSDTRITYYFENSRKTFTSRLSTEITHHQKSTITNYYLIRYN